jgi:D-sedoheptulose 7-phosphate isomerase
LKPHEYLIKTAQESISVKEAFVKSSGELIVQSAQILADCIHSGGKILILGNGGSAADAQHMAAELIGRMMMDRRPLPAIALTTDSSNLTAVANDFGYEHVFTKQVEALAKPEDVIIAISTSGKSLSVVAAAQLARQLGCKVIGLTGGAGGPLKDHCTVCLCVTEGMNSSRIQESHIFAIHSMVDLLDRFFLEAIKPSNKPGIKPTIIKEG